MSNTIINTWPGKWSKKWSGKRSPDFEGEFIEMFPMDRLAIFDRFWVVLRHFFFDVSEKCLTGYFCVTFRADHFPQILFFIAPTWGRFWPILVFSKFFIFSHILCMFFVYFLCMWPFLGEVFRSITCSLELPSLDLIDFMYLIYSMYFIYFIYLMYRI